MMRKVLIREQSFYTVDSLATRLGVDREIAAQCIECLTTRGVVKLRTSTEIRDYDPLEAIDGRGKYQFVFVGVVTFRNIAIVVYPKYLPESQVQSTAVLRQAFLAMRRASGSFSQIAATTEDGLRRNDRLSLIMALIESYEEYGVYSNFVRTYENNGVGDIAWNRTIALHTPVLSHGRPVYLEYESNKTSHDESNFITRLHRCVLTQCSKYLAETELGELLGIDEINLSDEGLEDFGDAATVAYRIEREFGVQFVTWKQETLRMLRRFIVDEEVLVESDEVQCLGTSSFYNVWEKACKIAFGDMVSKRLDAIGVELRGDYASEGANTVLGIIPHPAWFATTGAGDTQLRDTDTLIPDIVTIAEQPSGGRVFAILDAKYYTPVLKYKPFGVPGVESVTKQFLYQAAYKEFVEAHGFDAVVNAFLVPLATDEVVRMGYVEFPKVIAHEDTPFSNEVVMWGLPAGKVFAAYLSGSLLEDEALAQILTR